MNFADKDKNNNERDNALYHQGGGESFRYLVFSLGCKSNQYEADALKLHLRHHHLREAAKGEKADVVIVNTCTVTAEAGRKSCQQLRRLRREHPEAILAAMGCHAELENLCALCDLSIGTSGRAELAEHCLALLRQRRLKETTEPEPLPALPEAARIYEELGSIDLQTETRAQIKIQDGCDNMCSYCAIRLARGRARSRSRAAILAEAGDLAARGVKEVVLTGTHICSFEKEQGRDSLALAELLRELEQIEGIGRVRLGSLEPAAITEAFITKIADLKKLCPYFHLSLQSGSDEVLAKMRRRYDTALYRRAVGGLRDAFPDCGLGSDVICGFPEETEAAFEQSLRYVEETAFTRLHVFPFSLRAGTAAEQLRAVAAETIRERTERMLALARRLAETAALRAVGREAEILLERETIGGIWEGYSRDYLPLRLRTGDGDNDRREGEIVRCRLEAAEGGKLLAAALC